MFYVCKYEWISVFFYCDETYICRMADFGLNDGVAYYTGNAFQTGFHSHHALEFVFSLSGTFSIDAGSSPFTDITAVGILPNVRHRFIGNEGLYLFLFIEPELKACIGLQQQLFNGKDLVVPVVSGAPIHTNREGLLNLQELHRVLSVNPVFHTYSDSYDTRIVHAMNIIKQQAGGDKLTLKDVADAVNLSEGRFRHLFSEQIGLPFGRYVLWHRLQKALLMISGKHSLTIAAHESGFSDSAHLSRVFTEMFGIAPSKVLKKIA